jgi:putative ribosome biogenesis GTPase RsgA
MERDWICPSIIGVALLFLVLISNISLRKDQLHFVLLGKMGVGKSTMGNVMLEGEHF